MDKNTILGLVGDIRREYNVKRMPLLGKKLQAIEDHVNGVLSEPAVAPLNLSKAPPAEPVVAKPPVKPVAPAKPTSVKPAAIAAVKSDSTT